jgi:hypothetical protein
VDELSPPPNVKMGRGVIVANMMGRCEGIVR